MTNFEFYKDRIKELCTVNFGRDKDGNLHNCWDVECEDCTFKSNGNCSAKVVDFLYAEHKEATPKLTNKERQLCVLLGYGYIARDLMGFLFWYKDKPFKDEDMWDLSDGGYIDLDELSDTLKLKFNFIKWEDEEPWSIKDLLKLEVIEE